jgi:hypothetical protein
MRERVAPSHGSGLHPVHTLIYPGPQEEIPVRTLNWLRKSPEQKQEPALFSRRTIFGGSNLPRRPSPRGWGKSRPAVEALEGRVVMTFIPLASPVDVSGLIQGNQRACSGRSIGEADNGNFAVIWEGYNEIDAGVFGPDGSPLVTPFRVTSTAPNDTEPLAAFAALAMGGSGRFVVAWKHELGAGGNVIYAQPYWSVNLRLIGRTGPVT